jgi:predicted metalloprotease with PDZ domain
VSLDERAQHRASVEMTITGVTAPLELWMPVWTPGAYELRSWARNLTPLGASDGSGRTLAITRTGPSSFRVDGASGTVQVRYRVYAARLSDDGSDVDGGHALLNGSSLLLAVRGQERGLHELRIALPAGWRAATALDEDAGGWAATSYEALIDAPIECGRFAEATAHAAGRSYRIVVDGAAAVPARFVDEVARVAEAEAHAAGPPPYHRYVVVIHLSDEAGRVAALEHAASTSILVPRNSFSDAEAYDELVYVVAHELFHAWNAKLVRPAELVPYDLSRAQLSRSLWITEGLTEYFAHRALLRARHWTRAEYLAHVGDEAERAVAAERRGVSVEEAAELTWQPPDESDDDPDAYYARGHLVALAVDAAMRVRTGGRHGLEEVMRALFADAERRGGPAPIDSVRLAHAVDALAPGVGAKLLGWVRVPDERAGVTDALAAIGLGLACKDAPARTVAGFAAERDRDREELRVVAVGSGGPADLAGVKPGDRVTAVDGAAPPAQWSEAIAHKAAGAPLVLAIARGARALEIRLTLGAEHDTNCKLTQPAVVPEVARLREALLTP